MLNKGIAICLLLFFIAVKCTVLFSRVADQSVIAWSDQSEEQGDQQEETKEPKQSEKEFDEFFQSAHHFSFYIPSLKLHPGTSKSPITEYLPSPDLPPEVVL
ncbi:MAG: hypothetical protein V4687_04380 [Bacteroidota bacterium]